MENGVNFQNPNTPKVTNETLYYMMNDLLQEMQQLKLAIKGAHNETARPVDYTGDHEVHPYKKGTS